MLEHRQEMPISRESMLARIFKPARTAMQSGNAAADKWVLEYEPELRPAADPLMGYT
jgi:hypothetical protein